VASDTGVLNDVAALIMMITLFSAGGESTASLIGSAAWILATKPAVQRGNCATNRNCLARFSKRCCANERPLRAHYRHVLNNTELCAVRLPAESRLLLLWGAANRDPLHFDNAGQFRLDRPMVKGHVTFGRGIHFCAGAALARLEASLVLSHLLEHLHLALA
jgi:cytochrome P450